MCMVYKQLLLCLGVRMRRGVCGHNTGVFVCRLLIAAQCSMKCKQEFLVKFLDCNLLCSRVIPTVRLDLKDLI